MGSSTLEWVGTAVFCTGASGLWAAEVFPSIRRAVHRERLMVRAARRSRFAMTVATDASLDTEAFEPAVIGASVDEMLSIVTRVWAGDGEPVEDRSDLGLIQEWARSVSRDLGSGLRLTRSHVDVLRVVNRPGEREDRIVLRVKLGLRRAKDQPRAFGQPRSVSSEFRWTLGRVGSGWRLLTIDAAALSEQALDAPLIPGAWADEDRLWEEALAELADADAHPGHIHLTELVHPDAPVEDQLTEISTLDRRFDRDLIAARLRRIVEAWEEASAGSQDLLAEVAAQDAAAKLLHGPPRDRRVRLILHDATIETWRPVKLELSAAPEIRIAIVVSAVRYLVWDSTGRWAAGDTERRHEIALEWTLTLFRDPGARWQLTSTSSPITLRAEPQSAELTLDAS